MMMNEMFWEVNGDIGMVSPRVNKHRAYRRKIPMFTTSKYTRVAVIMLSLGAVIGTTELASAGVRRAEVNMRLARQNYRIDKAVEEGKLTHGQAAVLHADDKAIRNQERFDAKFDNGHITHSEQKTLNQLENGVSKKIP
jgi:hypothetical protein